MEDHVKLKDGTEVLIREMTTDDVDRSVAFFEELPEEDKIFLRRPIPDREAVIRRIKTIEAGTAQRLVAIDGDKIVADGALEHDPDGWREHVGEMRLIVARSHQGKGLGRLMAFELYKLANHAKVEEIIVKIMGPQKGVQKMFQHLGFHPEAELHDFVKDLSGVKQDLVLMRCKLQELWQRMEDEMTHSDWRPTH
jgi:L-amino acid N-acyltransferase YncA